MIDRLPTLSLLSMSGNQNLWVQIQIHIPVSKVFSKLEPWRCFIKSWLQQPG